MSGCRPAAEVRPSLQPRRDSALRSPMHAKRFCRQPPMVPIVVALVAGVATFITCAAPVAADLADPGPYEAGRRTVAVSRPNGSTFQATFVYPATASGANTPFDASGGPYPVFSFGHGFLTPVSRYDSTLDHLATHGFLVIASRSGGELFPSHAAFAADLVHCLDHVIALGEDPASEFHQHVAADRLGVGGHSMGGGCSLLAAASDARIGAVVPLAAADTNPSSIAASGEIAAPVRLIVGSEDAIVPSGPSSGPMYSNLRGPRQLVSIEGGSHCGFLDSDIIFCDTGSITRAAQLAHTWRLATSFLLLHLADEESLWREVWGPLASPQAGLELEIDPRLAIVPSSRTLEVPASGLEVAWSVQNTGEEPCTVAFQGDPGTWATVAPESVALEPGATLDVAAAFDGQGLPPKSSEWLLIARRDDGAAAWATATIVPIGGESPDLDGDGIVNGADLAVLLSAYGSPGPGDLDGNGTVDGADLSVLLAAWSNSRP